MRTRYTSDEFTDDDTRPYLCVVLPNGDEIFIVNRKQATLLPTWASDLHWNQVLELAEQPKIPARQKSHDAEIIDIETLRARRVRYGS